MKLIDVHRLNRQRRATTDRTFPVRWFTPGGPGPTDILASCTVTGDEADSLVTLFDAGFKLIEDTTLCGHYPNYGLRYFEDAALALETTVCLSCANWIADSNGVPERYRIDFSVFRELSSRLQLLLPLPPDEQPRSNVA